MTGTGSLARRLRRDRRGVTTLLVSVSLVALLGVGALVTDVGMAYAVKNRLQASTNAAALAGAAALSTATTSKQVTSAATLYSSAAGGKNGIGGATVAMPAPTLKCFKSLSVSCSNGLNANGVVVQQTATVPSIFGGVLGVKSFTITTSAAAGAQGGIPTPVDVVLILDTTASMNQNDPNCSIGNVAKLACALAGVQTVLNTLPPSVDQIGLLVFPGLDPASAANDASCKGSAAPPKPVAYGSATITYHVVPFSSDYRTSDSATSLNPNSSLVKAGGGAPGCPAAQAPGGMGTFYADALTAAQTYLATQGRAGVQKVIILLSDGDANAKAPAQIVQAESASQCHAAITAAHSAAAAGTWVYAIAYQAPTTNSCTTDQGANAISACAAMQAIASDPSKFFTDTTSGACQSSVNSVGDLIAAFRAIATSMLKPRLIPSSMS